MIVLSILTYLLNIVDYLETVYLIDQFGLCVEGNPVMKYMFEQSHAFEVKVIYMAVLVSIVGVIARLDKCFRWAPWTLFIFYFCLVLHNLNVILQLS